MVDQSHGRFMEKLEDTTPKDNPSFQNESFISSSSYCIIVVKVELISVWTKKPLSCQMAGHK